MRQLTWIAAIALLSTAACKKDDKSKPDVEKPKTGEGSAKVGDTTGSAGGGGTTTDTPKTPTPAGGPEVKLVSNGAEPRAALRYAPAQGDKDKLDMVMTMGMDAAGMKIKIPPMTMSMDCEVLSVSDGSFELAATVSDVKVDAPPGDQMGAALQPELTKMVGMKMTNKMTKRGILESADIKLPPNINPQMMQMMDSMKQSMAQATAPFPEEPVGVGAKWTVNTELEANGMKVKQTATFELTALEGTKTTMKVKLEQTAPPQDVNAPGMPPGVKTKLNKLSGGGEGEMNFDLSRVVPIKGKLAIKSDADTTVEQGTTKQNVSVSTVVDIDIKATKVK